MIHPDVEMKIKQRTHAECADWNFDGYYRLTEFMASTDMAQFHELSEIHMGSVASATQSYSRRKIG